MAKSPRPPSRSYWIGMHVLGIACLVLFSCLVRDRAWKGINDFLQLYNGGRLLGTAGLYSPGANEQLQMQTVGAVLPSVYYSRPPFYALFLKPFTYLPYQTAYVVYSLLSIAAYWWFLRLYAPRAWELAAIGAISLPVIVNICAGNDITFALLAAGLSLLAARQGRDFLAGLLLAACAIKFHLFLLAPVPVLLYKRWRILYGGVVGVAVLLAISFLTAGWHWPQEYLALLRNPELSPHPDHMPTIRGLLFTLGIDYPAVWTIATVGGIGLFAVLAQRLRSYEMAFGFSMIAGVFLSLHAYIQDCALFLLPLALLIEANASPRLKSWLAIATFPPLYLGVMCAAPWVAGVPVVSLAVLGLAWWETRRPAAAASSTDALPAMS